jgi:hypothetical protein
MAEDTSKDNRQVFLKEFTNTDTGRALFNNELDVAKLRLSHKNVLKVLGANERECE